MVCDMEYETLELLTESEEAKLAWQGMVASSSLADRLKGWSSCIPMHEGSLNIAPNNIVDLRDVKIPCEDTIMEGRIVYYDVGVENLILDAKNRNQQLGVEKRFE